jgi:hypothetical protein
MGHVNEFAEPQPSTQALHPVHKFGDDDALYWMNHALGLA